MSSQPKDLFPGLQNVVETLQNVDQRTYETVLKNLAKENQALVHAIMNAMFTFEHLHLINPKGLQLLFKKFSLTKWAIALKTASEDVKSALYDNVSERVRKNLKEEMLAVGKRKLSEVHDVQKEIMDTARMMKEKGELVIADTPEDPLV